MKRTYEKERVAALSAGLAIIVLAWTGAQAFASNWIDSLGVPSVWLYGPIRAQRRNPALCPEQEEVTRELRRKTCELTKLPKCIEYVDELERDKLGALMAGFAVTIAAWLALLSFAPPGLLDSIVSTSPWIYSLATMLVWWGSAEFTYWIFRRGRQHRSSITHAY
jgi:hypothetical protein